jgi:hypothetical protein
MARGAADRCGMASSTALGAYLRARREEPAMLAGISSDYYRRYALFATGVTPTSEMEASAVPAGTEPPAGIILS